jgi:hypothetical protein
MANMSSFTETQRARAEACPGSIPTWDSYTHQWMFRSPPLGDLHIDKALGDGNLPLFAWLQRHDPFWEQIIEGAWNRAAISGSVKRLSLLATLDYSVGMLHNSRKLTNVHNNPLATAYIDKITIFV